MVSGPHLEHWLQMQAEAERPFVRFDGMVPPADLDIAAALSGRVVAPAGPREEGAFDDFGVKARNLARAFAGQPEVLLINAQIITLLRRRDPPGHVPALFARLWTEAHETLGAEHDLRWIIPSAETLARFGATEVQRRTGLGLSVLCKTVKLYETERLWSGSAPEAPFGGRRAEAAQIALDQRPFAIAGGDLDRALITGIWLGAQGDTVAETLAVRLIPALLADDRAVFRRLRRMRARWRARRSARQP